MRVGFNQSLRKEDPTAVSELVDEDHPSILSSVLKGIVMQIEFIPLFSFEEDIKM